MGKNNMKQVANLLGLELHESFYISGWNNKEYVITEKGLELVHESDLDEDGFQIPSFASILNDLLMGKLMIAWEPDIGEVYYYPHFAKNYGYDYKEWHDNSYDILTRINVGIYKDSIDAMRKSLQLGWITQDFYNKALARYYANLLKDDKEL